MSVLRHEGWDFGTSSGFGPADHRSGRERFLAKTPGRMTHVIYAGSHEEAMIAHHRLMGWAEYSPVPGVTDKPYTAKALAAQLEQFPQDRELRERYGL